MSIYKKLNDARAKFHALKLEKTGHNKFAGYKYFELADFLVPALNVFNEVGLCAVVSFAQDMATMVVVDADAKDDDHCIRITSPMGSANLKGCHEVQNIGACETYARRYLWVAALEIVEHDALDATTGKDEKGDKTKTISAPKEAAKSAVHTPERIVEMETAATDMVDLFLNGEESAVLAIWKDKSWDNEEKIWIWNWLQSESKLRAFLKANKEQT